MSYCPVSTSLHHYERQQYLDDLRAERITEVSKEWLAEKIKEADLDELWCAVGDDLNKVLWEAGVSGKPFLEDVERRILEEYREELETYVECSVDLEEWR